MRLMSSNNDSANLGGLLRLPEAGQLLYKIMKVEDLLSSICGSYLHFQRVDSYKDSPNADPHDGQQLDRDLARNTASIFEKTADFSLADYFDRSRARTYACCFSMENSDYIWHSYGNGSAVGKVCLAFQSDRLLAKLNYIMQSEAAAFEYHGVGYTNYLFIHGGVRCGPIFSLNYGEVSTSTAKPTKLMRVTLSNTYIKDKRRFSEEQEFRVSLSVPGMGRFVVAETQMDFPPSLQMQFDYHAAFADGTI